MGKKSTKIGKPTRIGSKTRIGGKSKIGRSSKIGSKTDRAGRTRESLFFEPEYKYLADMVQMDTPENARRSVERLTAEWRSAKTDDKRLRIERAMDVAAKRAAATLLRKNLSDRERKEFKEIARIYQQGLTGLRASKRESASTSKIEATESRSSMATTASPTSRERAKYRYEVEFDPDMRHKLIVHTGESGLKYKLAQHLKARGVPHTVHGSEVRVEYSGAGLRAVNEVLGTDIKMQDIRRAIREDDGILSMVIREGWTTGEVPTTATTQAQENREAMSRPPARGPISLGILREEIERWVRESGAKGVWVREHAPSGRVYINAKNAKGRQYSGWVDVNGNSDIFWAYFGSTRGLQPDGLEEAIKRAKERSKSLPSDLDDSILTEEDRDKVRKWQERYTPDKMRKRYSDTAKAREALEAARDAYRAYLQDYQSATTVEEKRKALVAIRRKEARIKALEQIVGESGENRPKRYQDYTAKRRFNAEGHTSKRDQKYAWATDKALLAIQSGKTGDAVRPVIWATRNAGDWPKWARDLFAEIAEEHGLTVPSEVYDAME